MIEIHIPETAPTLNRLIRLHWAKRRKLIKKWEWWMLAALSERAPQFAALRGGGKLAIRITRRSHHKLDPDNLYGSAKVILDAMKHVGLIDDDSPEHIQLTCEQESGTPETIILINLLPRPLAHPVSHP